ncbi:LysR substrate-binding domain-containing protein [Enterobacter sp. DTU_2021_1002640_1_SI_PRY_ASU_LCPMC_013]|uniref:LysR substrate-binding domain-containing protein n=1 Tax=Enterobacter sp. DTU_2021_1002640_1_SI_PRY_ASU_LCPMC_013 TaxID=3077940 RepID=UPI0028E97D6A|nr:LysR substrate-binding domain-containing protein [Enterobacter sp. DTU_2021_1002640_1_SI_PRY_ASU_LCPMC_013]WNU99047.1 LysR substrate-binding domain-containing protein [Enterobacter sp. DTU_2021_1002640_1_SI_PRY_ASU_LCPMC_013]
MIRIRTLPHLLAFDAAARHESFSLAAMELCLTTGAVSRHITNLETKLGEELFFRGHKKVKLTPRGRIFALTCRKILDELAAAEAAFTEKPAIHYITINCLPTFSMYWLLPRLADFHQACPHIHINVVTSTGMITPGSDFAIRRDPIHFPGMEAVPFLEERSILVCSPASFLKQQAQSPDNTLIHIRVRNDLWDKWSAQGLTLPENITRHVHLDHTFAGIHAAEENLGIALVPRIFCEKHLASGRLVWLDSYGTLLSGNYFLVRQKRETPAMREFITWLRNSVFTAPLEPGKYE